MGGFAVGVGAGGVGAGRVGAGRVGAGRVGVGAGGVGAGGVGVAGHLSHVTGHLLPNFLHRLVFFLATQAQSLVFFLNTKEATSSQPGSCVGVPGVGEGGAGVGLTG